MSTYIRYDRQLDLIGIEGQKKLSEANVVIIGAGGLGSPILFYLSAAGIGRIHVFDNDEVAVTDLNRQILYTENDIGKKKAKLACERIKKLNSSIDITCIDNEFNESSGRELIRNADIVIDAVDNWETRYEINKLCVEYRKPFVHAGVMGWYGQATTIIPGRTPCLFCIMPKPPPRKKIPVIGVTPGVLGTIEATEVIKYLLGLEPSLISKLLIVDLLHMDFKIVDIKKNPQCPICGAL